LVKKTGPGRRSRRQFSRNTASGRLEDGAESSVLRTNTLDYVPVAGCSSENDEVPVQANSAPARLFGRYCSVGFGSV
jgi:hypothetical protein